MTTTKNLLEINFATMAQAQKSIIEMVSKRSLVLSETLNLDGTLNFPSQNKTKEFKKNLNWVIEYPTMKRISIFLRMYAEFTGTKSIKIDFSPKEKKIKEARKAYIEARKKAQEAQSFYKEVKGDFYKSIRL